MILDNNINESTLIASLALIDSSLFELSSSLAGSKIFKSVDDSYRISFDNYVNKKSPSYKAYLNCELLNLIDDDIHTLSLDINICFENTRWLFEGSINWYGYDIGGICIFDHENSFAKLSSLNDEIGALVSASIEKLKYTINLYKNKDKELIEFFEVNSIQFH